MTIRVKLLLIVLLGAGSFFGLSAPLFATGGITVSPAFLTTSISSKHPTQDLAIGVRNDASAPVQMRVSLGGIDQDNGRLVPTTQIDQDLKAALSISPTEFTLDPQGSINVKLHVENTAKLGPGGHYATIIISYVSEQGHSIGLQPAVSVSLFVSKEDGAQRAVVLSKFTAHHSLFSLPSIVDLSFKNTGNVVAVPRAALQISKGGQQVSKGTVNDESIPIGPGAGLTDDGESVLHENGQQIPFVIW